MDQRALTEIKERINLVDFISDYGIELKRVGSSVKACCPFHNEKTPSFHINAEKGFYKCFGCGEHGDVFTFMQKYEGIPFQEAVRKLAERVGIKLEERYDPQERLRTRLYQINQELAAFYRRCLLQTREGKIARDYLASRELSEEVAERFCIGYAPMGQDTLLKWAEKHGFSADEMVAAGVLAPPRRAGDRYYDRFHGRLTFPICDTQGRVIAFSCRLLREAKHTGKYVNSPETEIFKKAHTLYALHLARANIAKASPHRAIVCEGQIDVIRCHACGFNVAVASQGTAFTAEHVAMLKRYADAIDLVFDGDAAGIKATLRTMELFLSAGVPVRVVSLPPGEDPDSFLRAKGASALQERLNAAEDPAPFLVRSLKAQEANPETMEATIQIARTAVMTVANCPVPVLTIRFLQDVADALHLPLETLQTDLDGVRKDAEEAAKRRANFLARQTSLSPSAERPIHGSMDDLQPFEEGGDEMAVDDVSNDVMEDAPESDEVFPSAVGFAERATVERNLSNALCELLFHHFTDKEVMACLLQHLPPSFIRDPYTSKVYDLAVNASLHNRSNLEPDSSDEQFVKFWANLVVSPNRIDFGTDDDFVPLSYARELVRRYWLHEFEYREQLLPPDSTDAFQLTLNRKRLQTLDWEFAAPFMDALNPNFLMSSPPPEKALDLPTNVATFSEPPQVDPSTVPLENTNSDFNAIEDEWMSDDEGDLYDML